MKRELSPLDPMLARARDLPFAEPSGAQVEEMRTAVLAMMPTRAPASRRMTPWVVGGAGVAAAAAIAIVMLRGSTEPARARRHASVRAVGPAVFVETTQTPDEIVRLADGTLHLEVTPLASGERCRVIVGDDEVEVRGTAFVVAARRGRLESVAVEHGRVEVRALGATRMLDPGQHWDAPHDVVAELSPSPPPPAPKPVPAAPRDRGASAMGSVSARGVSVRGVSAMVIASEPPVLAPPAASHSHDAEIAFRAGWDALGSGDPDGAAVAFHRALTLAPDGNIADDASYWRAVALVRAHRSESARNALELFLVDFPKSMHAGDASVALGLLLIDTGEVDAARARFHYAESDASARVREAARAGLAALAH